MAYSKKCANLECDRILYFSTLKNLNRHIELNTQCPKCNPTRRYKKLNNYKEELQKLIDENTPVLQIAKQFDVSYSTVIDYAGLELGLNLQVNDWNRIRWIDEKTIECVSCELRLDADDNFWVGFKRAQYMAKCHECRNALERQNYIEKSYTWKSKITSLKRSSAKRNLNDEVEITEEYLEQLYTIQKGLCVYTGVELIKIRGEGTSRNSLSVDRIDPTRGYIPTNIVLCANRCNFMRSDMTLKEFKEWMPTWYKKVVALDKTLRKLGYDGLDLSNS